MTAVLIGAPAAAFAQVAIDVRLAEPGRLAVRYAIPERCRALQFRQSNDRSARLVREATWSTASACASLQPTGITFGENCRSAEFEIRTEAAQHDRLYPGSFPFGVGAIVHTGYLAVDDTCAPTTWRFAADGGAVLQQGIDHGAVFEPRPAAAFVDNAYVLLTRAPRIRSVGPLQIVVAPSVDDDTANLVGRALAESTRVLGAAQRRPWSTPATVMVTQDPAPSRTIFHGDVTRLGMVRLSLFDSAGRVDSSKVPAVTGFVAHELTHLQQPDWVRQDSWLSEGGAELGRLAVLGTSTTPSSDERAVRPIAHAIDDCLLSIGEGHASRGKASAGGATPYACGLALNALWLANIHKGHVRLGDLFDAYRDEASPSPRLPAYRRLFDGSGLQAAARRSGLWTGSRPWSRPEQQQVLASTLSSLMAQACHGAFGVRTDAHGLTLDAPNCGNLADGARLERIGGIDVDAPELAARRLAAACERDNSVVLAFEGGHSIVHTCGPLGYEPPREAITIREPAVEIETPIRTTRPAAPRRPPSSRGSRAAR